MQTERPLSARSSPARGVVLIAAAVVLGLFVLRAIDDSSPSGTTVAGSQDAAGGGGTATTAAQGGGTTTTATPARQPGQVTARVANASGVQGAAKAKTDLLKQKGYKTVGETNAPNGQRLTATQVLFVKGFDREAKALAATLGAPAAGVKAMPAPPPIDLAGAQVLVLLGTDIAQG